MQYNFFDVVSGEKLQALADFHWRPVDKINEYDPNGSPDLPKRNCVVYCCGDYILDIFQTIRENPDNKYILITHNSDTNIGQNLTNQCPENVVVWFGQNMNVPPSDRFVCLPIGIANSKWPHGNTDQILKSYCQYNANDISSVAYMCVKVETNPSIRSRWYKHCKFLQDTGIGVLVQNWPIDRQEFLDRTRTSLFSLCPPGNGVDTHRVWESFLLGRPAVVQKDRWVEHFSDLPFVCVDKPENLSNQFFQENLSIYKRNKPNYEKMYIPYWKGIISNKAKELL